MTRQAPVLAWGTVRYAAFPDRVAAAAAAGYSGIGLAVPYYRRLRAEGWRPAELRAVLDDHGIVAAEAEVLFGFCAPPGPANVPGRPGMVYADPEVERAVVELGDELGVPLVQAVGTFDDRPVDQRVVDSFGELCDRLGPHGLTVALEFVPYTNIPDVSTADRVVTAAGRANGGLCVDSWHFFRGDADWAALSSVPADRIVMVQVNDGPLRPETDDVRAEAVSRRRCVGRGEFALGRFLDVVRPPGDPRPVSVEIYSDALDRLTSVDAAHAAVRGV
ncbi:sugar phosphate isomerase/epimerase family protein [Pseudonocardia sp. NPDC049154]|uniref:sugar phosphate isomerase/epimerase family protein n=1 Tax=Pseudonocardia sp. NPDC049154 TaxID=3155501 RepID=UPI0033C36DD5